MIDLGKRFLRLKEVMQKTGLGRSSIYSYMDNGTFPKSIKVGPRCIGWHETSIDTWMESRIEQSTSK